MVALQVVAQPATTQNQTPKYNILNVFSNVELMRRVPDRISAAFLLFLRKLLPVYINIYLLCMYFLVNNWFLCLLGEMVEKNKHM